MAGGSLLPIDDGQVTPVCIRSGQYSVWSQSQKRTFWPYRLSNNLILMKNVEKPLAQ
jgi:hypothetical protein